MRYQSIAAVFTDTEAADKATYQMSMHRILLKDLAQLTKENSENAPGGDQTLKDSSFFLGYATSQFSSGSVATDFSAATPAPFLLFNEQQKKLYSNFLPYISAGQIVWTAKVPENHLQNAWRILEECGATHIENLS